MPSGVLIFNNMPEKGRRSFNARHPIPALIVSDPSDHASSSPSSSAHGSLSREQDKHESDGTSIPRSRRRRRSKHPKQATGRSSTSDSSRSTRFGSPDSSNISRFFPRLSRILETGDTSPGSQVEPSRRRHRPVKHRVGNLQRRSDPPLLRASPSLLSVLSGLTGVSDRSSGSNSTVTQKSYDRQGSRSTHRDPQPPEATDTSFNVFDYMMPPTTKDQGDARSVRSASTVSSRSSVSTADSSDMPGTPSSRSTAPSQSGSRKNSMSKYRAYPDASHAKRQPSVVDVSEADDDEDDDDDDDDDEDEDERTPHKRVSIAPETIAHGQSQQRSDHFRQHYLATSMHTRQNAPHGERAAAYAMHRSGSMSSNASDPYTAYYSTMQQYQYPTSPPAAVTSVASRPSAPDAPDTSSQTLTGYEMIARELSTDSDVKPLYRKFDYLNHRILLHLQDELSELEEQLRVIDEVIAQLDASSSDEKKKVVASRRADAWKNSDIHRRRTDLLGRIFMKTEQYSRAMTSYANLCGKSTEADEEQIYAYRKWMVKNAPIHEVETRFLERSEDLILPGVKRKEPAPTETPSSRQSMFAYLPVALMLPLLLYSAIPSVTGRLVVTAFVAGGAFLIGSTTELRTMLPMREWAICGAAYVLVMAAIAGCIPTHSTVVMAPTTPLAARYTVKR